MRLFHVSDNAGIARFEPRAAADGKHKVWAIEARTLANYLLPRDCPRVCARPRADCTESDVALLGGAAALVAIETTWLDRVNTASLSIYDVPSDGFVLEDQTAGYWTNPATVTPIAVRTVADLPARIADHGARLLVLPSLWPLHDRIAASSLDFSMIRMRNAAPR